MLHITKVRRYAYKYSSKGYTSYKAAKLFHISDTKPGILDEQRRGVIKAVEGSQRGFFFISGFATNSNPKVFMG